MNQAHVQSARVQNDKYLRQPSDERHRGALAELRFLTTDRPEAVT